VTTIYVNSKGAYEIASPATVQTEQDAKREAEEARAAYREPARGGSFQLGGTAAADPHVSDDKFRLTINQPQRRR
jgi:hypothetical protein